MSLPKPPSAESSATVKVFVQPEERSARWLKALKRVTRRRHRWLSIWLLSIVGFGLGALLAYSTLLPSLLPGSVPFSRWGGDRPASAKVATVPKDVSGLVTPLIVDQPVTHRYGHVSHIEANRTQLMVISSYTKNLEQRFERLRSDAALSLMQLLDAARANGVWIVPVSGFRDRDRQEMLFEAQVQELGSEELAARSVAPPGYSEHHTGYAIDLADGIARARDVSISFVQTEAYTWLTEHAQEYGFELSFPKDNSQGVNFEPWHWRYIGSAQAAGTFGKRE